MERVVGTTTLEQLALVRMQYGIVRMSFEYFDTAKGPRCVVVIATKEHTVTGSSFSHGVKAALEVEAIDDALGRLKHLTGAEISREGAKTGKSADWSL